MKNRLQEFHEENGSDCLLCGNKFIYSNGASRDESELGWLREPPEDVFERASLQLRYHEEKLKQAISAFDRREAFYREKLAAIRNGHPYDIDEEEMEADLSKLRKEVRRCQNAIPPIREEMEANAPVWYRRQKERQADAAESQDKAVTAGHKLDRLRV